MSLINKVVGIALIGLIAAPALADASKEMELFTRVEHYNISYALNLDGTNTATYDIATKVLKEQAIEQAKQTRVSYSTSVEKAEVLHAYTQKPDGRRIDVPKTNYQYDINKGQDANSPAFSDYTSLSIIFPDVAVGDTVAIAYTITQSEPIFPGHFSTATQFPKNIAIDHAQIHIDAPIALWTQFHQNGLTPKTNIEKDGRKIIEWTFQNVRPLKSNRYDYSVYNPDEESGFSFSTFRSYKEISDAYGQRAKTRSVVTDSIRDLANEITKGKFSPGDQARALYEWVATNIHYAGNCVGVGAVVPRDLSFVISNKLGDCKDHATLLQTLLSAKGIDSTQALINAGDTYQLPKVPVVSMVNHVINYIPSLDLYLDSTSDSTPFGMLPTSAAGKPVLLVDGYKEGSRTAVYPSSANHQVVKTEVTIKEDGAIKGSVDVTLKGEFAVVIRGAYRQLSADAEDEYLKNTYRRNNLTGGGKLYKDDPKPLLDIYHYKVDFDMDEFINFPGSGAFPIATMFPMAGAIRNSIYSGATEDEEAKDLSCSGGTVIEEYIYHLPKTLKVIYVPKNISLANSFVSYRSSYTYKKNTLTVKRELIDKTVGNVCPIATLKEFSALAKKAQVDLKAQVLYLN